MKISQAKETLDNIEQAKKIVKEDEIKREKEILSNNLERIEEAINKKDFSSATRILNGIELDIDDKELWRKKINREKTELIKKTIPETLSPLMLLCAKCGDGVEPDKTESYRDNKIICFIGMCNRCEMRIVTAMPSIMRNVSPIEPFIHDIVRDVN